MNEYDENVERVSLVDADTAGNGLRRSLIIALTVVIIAVVGFFAWRFILSKPEKEKGVVDVAEMTEIARKPVKNAPPIGDIYTISDILINPARQRRIFMVSVGLEVAGPKVIDEIRRREPMLRDNLITLFSSQSSDVLTDIRYRQAFRIRVKKIMDFQLGEGSVKRVFFDKWVYQ